MGTLKLRKKPPAALPNWLGKFAVMRQSVRSKSIRFTRPHDTLAIATAEAVRLQSENPEQRFLVVHVVDLIQDPCYFTQTGGADRAAMTGTAGA